MIKSHKRILWVIAVLLSSVGPYCFSQSQNYSASELACNSPGNTNLNVLLSQVEAAASADVRGCHSEVSGGADGSNESSDEFVRNIEVVNESIIAESSRGNLAETEGVDRRLGLSSGRRSWREIIINW